jgi:hypothetical protein
MTNGIASRPSRALVIGLTMVTMGSHEGLDLVARLRRASDARVEGRTKELTEKIGLPLSFFLPLSHHLPPKGACQVQAAERARKTSSSPWIFMVLMVRCS